MSDAAVTRNVRVQGHFVEDGGAMLVHTLLGEGNPKVIIELDRVDADTIVASFKAGNFNAKALSQTLSYLSQAMAQGAGTPVEDSTVSTEPIPAPVPAVPQA